MIMSGDSGTLLRFPILDGGKPVDLTGATVVVTLKRGTYRAERPAVITDAPAGLCEIELTAEDTANTGRLLCQPIIRSGTNEFGGTIHNLIITDRL